MAELRKESRECDSTGKRGDPPRSNGRACEGLPCLIDLRNNARGSVPGQFNATELRGRGVRICTMVSQTRVRIHEREDRVRIWRKGAAPA